MSAVATSEPAELEELEDWANEGEYEPEELVYEGNEICEHGELMYGPTRNVEADYTTHDPHGFEHDDEEMVERWEPLVSEGEASKGGKGLIYSMM